MTLETNTKSNLVSISDHSTEETTNVINLLLLQDTDDANSDFETPIDNAYQVIYIPVNESQTNPTSKKRIMKTYDQKRKPINVFPQKKKLNIGWLHCPKEGKRFTQVRAINGGGLKNLELSKNDQPNLQEFLQLAKELFFKDKKITPYGPMSEMNFYIGTFDGQKIEEFTNKKGEKCDVWEYMQTRGITPSRINFYLLSESKNEENSEESIKDMQVTEPFEKESDTCEFYVVTPNSLCVKFRKNETEFNSKSECFKDAISDGLIPLETNFETFHALEYGYELIEVKLADQVYYKVEYKNECKEISLPSCHSFEPHSIIHQPETLLGHDGDMLGTALIPGCHECSPILTWYCDGELYAEGEKLYYITLSKTASYQCVIKCNEMESPIVSNILALYN